MSEFNAGSFILSLILHVFLPTLAVMIVYMMAISGDLEDYVKIIKNKLTKG